MSADSGEARNTPAAIAFVRNAVNSSQTNILTYATAPRNTEAALNQASNHPGQYYNPSFRKALNTTTPGSNAYTSDMINPIKIVGGIPQRPDANPYFLFFGKFCSQQVQNMAPGKVGHYDISGQITNQQPANIYNIPDYPKPYTLKESQVTISGTNKYPTSQYDTNFTATNMNEIIYDASSCPVNWRMFGPIQRQVLDWSANGITGGGGGSGSGTGTDLSFNNFFFKQPEMPLDCSCVFISGASSGSTDRLRIKWDKPFNRKSGTSYSQSGNRYFFKDGTNPVENWLPHFTEFVFDISGGPNNRTFSKDANGNFDHTGAFGLFSANNTEINLEARANPTTGSITANGTNYGTSGITTTIIDNFNPNSNSVNAGGTPNQSTSDIGLGSTYDIALYYRNESKINTNGLASTDLKYNNYNVCLFKNVIFGIPGFVNSGQSIVYWGGGGPNGRYYIGGVGPVTKDDKNKSNAGEGLDLPWSNTSILKVGYDCSLNMTGYAIGNAIQAPQEIPNSSPFQLYGIANQNISYNDFDLSYNLSPNGVPNTMNDTKQNWPNGTGTGGTSSNSGIPSASNDYLKQISLLADPAAPARDHPEYIYTITQYNTTNDTIDPVTNDVRKEPFSGTLPIVNVIPIWSRAQCNETNITDYENPLESVTEIPTTSTKEFLNLYSVRGTSGNPANQVRSLYSSTINGINHGYKGRGRQAGFNNYGDVIYVEETIPVPGNPTAGSWLELDSDNTVFRQLANHGSPKTGIINPTGSVPTYDEMVEADAFIGQVPASIIGTNPYTVSRVEFRADYGNPGSWTGVPFLTSNNNHIINIPTWSAGAVPSNLPTATTTNTYPSNTNLAVEFSASAPFDIGENDSETTYSSKRGYYLGFDISNVRVELDPWRNTLGVQGGNPFIDSSGRTYQQYRVGIMHKIKSRQTQTWLSNPPIKEFIFRLAKRNNSNITGSPNHVTVKGVNSNVTFTDFFGVKRLPANQSGNKDNAFGGTGLELNLSFDLDNIDENWIPHSGDTGTNDLVADVNYVIDPMSGQHSIHSSEFTWTNINNNEGITTPGQVAAGTSGSSLGSAVRFNSFVELHEGINLGTKTYSRAITEANNSPYVSAASALSGSVSRSGRPLFGVHSNQIYHAHNVTYSNFHNIKQNPNTTPNYVHAQKIVLSTNYNDPGSVDRFTWKIATGISGELFWDYTWPIVPNAPSQGLYLPSGFSGCELLELPPNFSISIPWGGSNSTASPPSSLRELPVLDSNLKASSPYSVSYNHSATLQDYQSMWCNGAFVGADSPQGLIVVNASNPYINYTDYYGQTQNYVSKLTTGSDVRGISIPSINTPISGGFGSFNYDVVKWILLKQTTVTNNNVTVNVKDKNNNDVNLGDYLLFYCEYRSSNSYGAQGQVILDSYSTWLNACSNSVPASNAIVKIGAGGTSNGGNNGCFAGGTLQNPQISDLGTGTGSNKTKYFLFGLKPGTRISKITLT